MSYMLSLSEQTKLNAFLSGILDDYKTGVITQIQAVGKIGNVFSALESGDSKKVVHLLTEDENSCGRAECPQKVYCARGCREVYQPGFIYHDVFLLRGCFDFPVPPPAIAPVNVSMVPFRDSEIVFSASRVASSFITLDWSVFNSLLCSATSAS